MVAFVQAWALKVPGPGDDEYESRRDPPSFPQESAGG